MYLSLKQPTKITYLVEAKTVFQDDEWHPAVTIKTSSGEGMTRVMAMGFDHPRFAMPYARALADEYRTTFAGVEEDE